MAEQTDGAAPTASVLEAPLGHSRSAHRVYGWCAHCKDYSPWDEVAAWRLRETDHQAGVDEVVDASRSTPGINATAEPAHRCPECRELMLTVVTVRVLTDNGPRVAGGWAYCTGCDATPHPLMDDTTLTTGPPRVPSNPAPDPCTPQEASSVAARR